MTKKQHAAESNAAILMPNWVGDFILGLSVILQKYSPNDAVTLIVPEKLASLSKVVNPYRTIIYRRGNRSEFKATIAEIQACAFTEIYLLPRSLSAGILAFRSGIPRRRGLCGEFRNLLLTERLPRATENRNIHLTNEYSAVLETPHVEPGAWPGISLQPLCISEYNDSIVLCPGAAYGPAKLWPGFRELVTLLPEMNFIILGTQNDAEAIGNTFRDHEFHVKNVAGKTTLAAAAAIISSASLVVSNDSGLLHLAGFLGVSCIGIYTSTSPEWTRPLGRDTIVFESGCACAPCFKRTCLRHSYECHSAISAQEIAQTVSAMRLSAEKRRSAKTAAPAFDWACLNYPAK